jgi:hypothetical protein
MVISNNAIVNGIIITNMMIVINTFYPVPRRAVIHDRSIMNPFDVVTINPYIIKKNPF